MSENDSFRIEVEAAAQDEYAILHKEIRLYLESWSIVRERPPRQARRSATTAARP